MDGSFAIWGPQYKTSIVHFTEVAQIDINLMQANWGSYLCSTTRVKGTTMDIMCTHKQIHSSMEREISSQSWPTHHLWTITRRIRIYLGHDLWEMKIRIGPLRIDTILSGPILADDGFILWAIEIEFGFHRVLQGMKGEKYQNNICFSKSR